MAELAVPVPLPVSHTFVQLVRHFSSLLYYEMETTLRLHWPLERWRSINYYLHHLPYKIIVCLTLLQLLTINFFFWSLYQFSLYFFDFPSCYSLHILYKIDHTSYDFFLFFPIPLSRETLSQAPPPT